MLPSIFGENLFDDWFESPIEKTFFGERNPLYGKHAKNLMKTDVRETDSSYELAIDLPGFKLSLIHILAGQNGAQRPHAAVFSFKRGDFLGI